MARQEETGGREWESTRVRRIGGLHPVETAIAGGAAGVHRVLADRRRRDARMRRILDHARRAGIGVERMTGEAISEWLGDSRHQGIAAEVAGPGILDEHDLLALVDGLGHPAFILALDGVQDPHNLGACMRTADAAGADAVVVPRNRAVGLTPAVERAAAGAVDRIPLAVVTNLARALEGLRGAGCWITGTAGDAGESLYDADLTGALVLVCGGEAGGLRQRTRRLCDRLVSIPLAGGTESLNVSVSAGICLFEALRQRGVAARRA